MLLAKMERVTLEGVTLTGVGTARKGVAADPLVLLVSPSSPL
jgi:hypothetical protein